jgi:subtilisin-like proprotein convertase family protein
MSRGTRKPIVALAIAAMAAAFLASAWSAAAADASQQVHYNPVPVGIPDGQGRVVTTFEVSSAPPEELLFSATSQFRVKHPRTGDLKLSLRGPNGKTRVISGHDTKGKNLGAGACGPAYEPSFGFTTFDPFASETIDDGQAPYVGEFTPAQSQGPLTGIDPVGKWKLIASDTKDGKRGRLLCSALVLDLKEP